MSLLRLRSLLTTGSQHSSTLFHSSSACAMAIRGPKKKKGGASSIEAPENPDIVNIFKGGKDAPVYPSEMYPPFVMELLREQYSPDEIMLQMYRGERIPTAKEQWTLANAVKRDSIKDKNFYFKQRYEYESDDDMGEDLGGNPEGADLDSEAGGQLEGGEDNE